MHIEYACYLLHFRPFEAISFWDGPLYLSALYMYFGGRVGCVQIN